MPAPQRSPSRPTPGRSAPDAVERLYAYWLASTALFMVVVLIVAILTRGALLRHATAINELSNRVVALEASVGDLQPAQPSRPPGLPEPSPAATTPAPATTEQPAAARPPGTATKPASAGPAPMPAVPVLTEDAVQSQLDDIMSADPVTPGDVARPEAGAALLETVIKNIGRAGWSGATWSRLAVLARLLGRAAAANACADRAAAGGDPLITYTEVSVRALLAGGRPQEALPLAAQLVERSAGSPASRALLATALLASDDPASADEVVETLRGPVTLDTYDQLLLARALLALEHWRRLEAVVNSVREIPQDLAAEHSFLLAITLARSGRTVEALAILDGLLPVPGADADATTGPADAAAYQWPRRGADRYEIEVWRGVTLMYARQTTTSRQVLQEAAELDPGRAEAHYYLGLLEARAGRPQVAVSHLKNALATSARMAPAWEALALLEIDNGQVNLALEHLAQATAINPRRASAHFLTALALAKLSRAEPAGEALRRAFHLDERILAEAKQTEVLLRLFTPEEMDRFAAEPAPGPEP